MKIVTIGGSAAGLIAAVVFARAGHEVVVVERDHLEPAADVEAAASTAFRASAPQIVQPHVVLARCRQLLIERLPDVYQALLDAGVVEAPLATQMPPTLPDRSTWPGDERLGPMMTRRATVDWVLRNAAAAEPGVTVRGGERVVGLLTLPGDPPRVVGVRTQHSELTADLVLDASGRRSPLDQWLDGIGARRSTTALAECGLAYYGRQYRVRPGADLPGPTTTRVVVPLDQFVVGIWGGDNDTMQLALVPLATDRRFRTARDPGVFTAALRTVPYYAAWLDALDPISDVGVMGGLHNTLRRLVVDGRPVALGLHVIGDSLCTTNPTFGRGLSLIMRNVTDLVEIVADQPGDLLAQAYAVDQAITENIAPWYTDQAVGDTALLAQLRHTVFGEPAPRPPPPAADRITFAELRRAAPVDPVAFRAYFTIMGMLGHPDDVYRDPRLIATVREVLARTNGAPRMPQPTSEELLTALSVPA